MSSACSFWHWFIFLMKKFQTAGKTHGILSSFNHVTHSSNSRRTAFVALLLEKRLPMQRKSYFEPESLWRSSLHCRLIYTSKSRNNIDIDFIAFSQCPFSLGKQAIFQSTRFHRWSVINYIKTIFLIGVYIMSSLACNFHLFACCILPPPAIICCYGSHIEKPHLYECLCAQLSPVASRINIIISAGHNI